MIGFIALIGQRIWFILIIVPLILKSIALPRTRLHPFHLVLFVSWPVDGIIRGDVLASLRAAKKITSAFTCVVPQVQVNPCMQVAIWGSYLLLGPKGPKHLPTMESHMQTILCVDDEPTQLMLLRLALTRAGYQVLEAPDGQKGIEMALEHKPALIIMDLMMPVMDGATAIWHIKQKLPQIPILVLSAYTRGDQAQRALEAGAAEMISKSLILTELIDKVNTYLR
jgi:CheY-like chemotaxis protein